MNSNQYVIGVAINFLKIDQLKLILFDFNIKFYLHFINYEKVIKAKEGEWLLVQIEQTEKDIQKTNIQDCRIRQCIHKTVISIEILNWICLRINYDDCLINLSNKEIDYFFVTRDQDFQSAYNLKRLSLFILQTQLHSYYCELQVAFCSKYT
ncbi:unnamed protein product [Paramecium octaurelia]|uniref:Uncharacterized protein n=1 Tax=Paramecium octaurelia TaxID=43137 RepID=A0A8S1Y5M4_PAROT|nr:unnamed protein product [Paramecium octaurelia]